jgi:hypothetical protein
LSISASSRLFSAISWVIVSPTHSASSRAFISVILRRLSGG